MYHMYNSQTGCKARVLQRAKHPSLSPPYCQLHLRLEYTTYEYHLSHRIEAKWNELIVEAN